MRVTPYPSAHKYSENEGEGAFSCLTCWKGEMVRFAAKFGKPRAGVLLSREPDPVSTEKPHDFVGLSIAIAVGLTVTMTVILLCSVAFTGYVPGNRDFVSYWASGQQLVHHASPYDVEAIGRIEHAAGFVPSGAMMMWNPPWILVLVYPLGFFDVRIAAALWTLLLLACLVTALRVSHALHGSPPNLVHWLGLSFAPALLCLIMGQTSLWALLGLALFLRFHSQRPFAAGLSLWLCALKPHLFLPFGIVLIVWMLAKRRYMIVAGVLVAFAISNGAAFVVAPTAWPEYLRMMRLPVAQKQYVPCLSSALQFHFDPAATWIQYLPAAIGCLWALGYFWRRHRTWDWISDGSPLLLTSLLVAPHCWFYDQTIAIPAILDGCYATRRRWMLTLLVVIFALAEIEMCRAPVLSSLYLWNMPVWIVWYLVARGSASRKFMHKAAVAS